MSSAGGSRYDEMLNEDGSVRSAYADFRQWYDGQDVSWLKRQDAEAERFFRRIGITFNVYGDDAGEERLIPFDMIPRIITAREWRKLTRGIEQRVRAINAFLQDLYHRQEIVKSGRLPAHFLRENEAFLSQMMASRRPAASTHTSWASTSSAPDRTSSWCWRTTPARRRASRTCSRTARR